jgi:hypothetical protein
VVVWRGADLLNKYTLHKGVLNKKYYVEYMINMPPRRYLIYGKFKDEGVTEIQRNLIAALAIPTRPDTR